MPEMNLHNKGNIKLNYDITLACNNRCSYCYALDYLDNSKIINEEVFQNVIKYVNELENVYLSILGGEPLLVYDKLIEFFGKIKCDYTEVISNFNFNPNSIQMKVAKDLNTNFSIKLVLR